MTTAHVRVLRLSGALRAKGHDVPEALLAAEWKAVDKAKTAAARRLAAAVEPVLADAVRDAASAGGTFRVELLTAELRRVLPPAVLDAIRAGFATGLARVNVRVPFDAERAVVRETVERLVALAESVPETMAGVVDTIVRDGLAAGLTGDEIGALIREAAPDMTAARAQLVGRTTAGNAFEAGQTDSYREAGVERKRWLSMRDANVRPEHADLDGEEVGINEAFSNGEDYPGEFNCRCTTLPVIGRSKAIGTHPAKHEDRPPVSWRDERDAGIRRDYPTLKAAHGAEVALSMLAERECLSYDHTRRIVRKGRRTG